MAEHDYVIANQNGANTRSDLNNALAAIVSNNSKATAPTTTYAFMWWADTANDILKQRNAADSAWISILTLSTGAPLGTLSSSLLSGALPAIDGSSLTNLPAPTGLDSSGGVARATSGLLFNADTAAANALDDYEEGTWTPTPNGGWGALTLSGTGTYTKVGNVVHLSAFFVVNGSGTGSGDVNIQGLPFTSNSNSNFNPAVAIHANKLNSAVPGCVTGFVYHNLNRIYIRESGTTSDGGDLGVHFDSGSDLYISTTYTI